MSFLYTLLITPLEYLFDMIVYRTFQVFGEPVIALLVLSVCVNVLTLPLYNEADRIEKEEQNKQKQMERWIAHIKKHYRGDERTMMLNAYYREQNYHPWESLKGTASLLLQIPFFIAAYHYISDLRIIQKYGFLWIKELAYEDRLLRIGDFNINILPIVMTLINCISGAVYARKEPVRKKVQIYVLALAFLVLLYHSPSALVLYWIFNNLFSLGKNVYREHIQNKTFFVVMGLSALPLLYIWHDAIALGNKHWYTAYNGYFFLVLMPLVFYIGAKISKHFSKSGKKEYPTASEEWIRTETAFLGLTLLLGATIPLSVMGAAPTDFAKQYQNSTLIKICIATFLVYAGIFMVWGNVIRFLMKREKRGVLLPVGGFLLLAFIAHYLFFGTELGIVSTQLVYEREPVRGMGEIILSLCTMVLLAVLVFGILRRHLSELHLLVAALIVAMLVMCAGNIIKINERVRELRDGSDIVEVESEEEITKLYRLDKHEKNVIVFMLDRAISAYIPYIFDEKPELKEAFDGFVYYPDTLSFGGHSVFGAPPLYGGYEYTPEEMEKRGEEPLREKCAEAARVMPQLFAEAGYDVTVTKTPIASLDAFDTIPGVNSIVVEGRYGAGIQDTELMEQQTARSFAFYSLFRVAPVLTSTQIYDHGNYQSVFGKADDMEASFMEPYLVLEYMPEATEITDGGQGSFLMMTNNTTHDLTDLQLPDYKPAMRVDNTAYDMRYRYTEDGRRLETLNVEQDQHYKIDMAAMLKLGEYFTFLKEQGVYDNTRIIIVSDHGHDLRQIPEMIYADGIVDAMNFNPVLLVKDFGSTGFSVSDDFMTNADVPVLATEGLLDRPYNPFSGQALRCHTEGEEYHVTISANRDEEYLWTDIPYNDTSDAPWYAVRNSIFGDSNWNLWKKQGGK